MSTLLARTNTKDTAFFGPLDPRTPGRTLSGAVPILATPAAVAAAAAGVTAAGLAGAAGYAAEEAADG